MEFNVVSSAFEASTLLNPAPEATLSISSAFVISPPPFHIERFKEVENNSIKKKSFCQAKNLFYQ
jgi:hypothetical protein